MRRPRQRCRACAGRTNDAIRCLQPLTSQSDTKLGASIALVMAHKLMPVVDKEAVAALEADYKAEAKSCGEMALYQGGLFLWLSGRGDRARELADKIRKKNPSSVRGQALRGWVDCTSGRDAHVKKAIKYFEEAIVKAGDSPNATDALFGKAK